MTSINATEHPTSEYDRQAREHYWHPEALFGLAYEYLQPGDRLLDAGIGTGLASQPFARAGVQVFGFDTDPEMLAACEAKGFTADLKEHDLVDIPWPYPTGSFDHVLACGVLHFLADLEPVFHEVSRLLRPNGSFVFTTKAPPAPFQGGEGEEQPFEETIQDTTLYLHSRELLDRLTAASGLEIRKELRLMIETGRGSDELFYAFVTRRAL